MRRVLPVSMIAARSASTSCAQRRQGRAGQQRAAGGQL